MTNAQRITSFAMNEEGMVIGHVYSDDNVHYGYLWNPKTDEVNLIDHKDEYIVLCDINEHNDVVGWIMDYGPFYWSSTTGVVFLNDFLKRDMIISEFGFPVFINNQRHILVKGITNDDTECPCIGEIRITGKEKN